MFYNIKSISNTRNRSKCRSYPKREMERKKRRLKWEECTIELCDWFQTISIRATTFPITHQIYRAWVFSLSSSVFHAHLLVSNRSQCASLKSLAFFIESVCVYNERGCNNNTSQFLKSTKLVMGFFNFLNFSIRYKNVRYVGVICLDWYWTWIGSYVKCLDLFIYWTESFIWWCLWSFEFHAIFYELIEKWNSTRH